MFYLYSDILTVLSQKFHYSRAFWQSPLVWQGVWGFGKAILREILHENFVFGGDLNKLVRLGLNGKKASEWRVWQGSERRGKEGIGIETSQRKGWEGGDLCFVLGRTHLVVCFEPASLLFALCRRAMINGVKQYRWWSSRSDLTDQSVLSTGPEFPSDAMSLHLNFPFSVVWAEIWESQCKNDEL